MSYISNRVQLYSENSELKYPLDDSSSGALRSDALLDLCISLPTALLNQPVWMTSFKSGPTGVFISFEQAQGAIAYLYEADPVPFQIYQLVGEDVYGTIVFGPGVLAVNSFVGVRELVDARCIFPGFDSGLPLKLSVNGFEYDMPSVLKIQVNDFIEVGVEERDLAGDVQNCLVLRRNDTKLSDTIIKTGLTDITSDIPLETLAGVRPDDAGNIDILMTSENLLEKVWVVPIKTQEEDSSSSEEGTPIGLLFMTSNVAGCPDPYAGLMTNILPSLAGYGISTELPLDALI